MNSLILGMKYFKYDDDDDLRVYKLIKTDPIVLKEIGYEEKTIGFNKESDLTDSYIRLNPDALIIFNMVRIRDLKDVIVTVYRKTEIRNADTVPYSVCRQNITDFFANSLDPKMGCYGVNVTKETIPQGVKIEQLTACDGIESNDTIAYYMGDSLKDLLGLLRKDRINEYDSILYNLFNDHIRYTAKSNGGELYITYASSKRCIHGYCKTLKDLLELNNFMFDLMRGFNIYPLDIDLTASEKAGYLTVDEIDILERLICKNITRDAKTQLIIKYDKDIDLDRINGEYLLIYDVTNTLYVVAFSTYGKYHIPVEDVESAENIEKLARSIGYNPNSSITEAYNHIVFDNSKYF